MIKQIQNGLFKIINIGIKSDYDSIERSRIEMVNALFVFVLPLLVINTFNNILEGDPIGFILGFVWLAFLSVPLLLNYFGKHKWSYGFLVVLSIFVANSGFIMFGKEIILAPLYIMGILASIFFFDRFYTRIGFIVFILFNYFFMQEFYLNNYLPIFPDIITGYGVHLYFLFSVFGVSATSMKILRANRNQIKETEKLNKQLEAKNQELERFAYITSHDLKEPIRNISRFSGLIKRRLKEGKDINEFLDFINENAKHLDEMVDSIQDFMKISEENLILEAVNLNEIINSANIKLQEKIYANNTQISYQILPTIQGNKHQLIILFQNLIENAIKYNNSRIPIIEISVKEIKETYLFQIKDNGIGVAEEFNEHIFMPFKKLHHKSKYEGAGVGLSICKRIIENHNGEIWVKNNTGKGASFYFTIAKMKEMN